jgi:N-methylhydantoinase A/oxoprolinase/acetone carboxylase beta subunit
VLVPRLAAVFSAFGIGFSDIARSYEAALTDPAAVNATYDALLVRAERDMFQEGYDLHSTTLEWAVIVEDDNGEIVSETPYRYSDHPAIEAGRHASLRLTVTAELPHASLADDTRVPAAEAVAMDTRQVRSSGTQVDEVPVYALADQPPGATAAGPAIVEGPYFTARVLDGWQLEVTSNGDLILTDTH